MADIPPKYGMLLSRSWGAKLQGTLQTDMTYAIIPVFSQPRRLYVIYYILIIHFFCIQHYVEIICTMHAYVQDSPNHTLF